MTYSRALARYFLAEGTIHKHELYVVNLDEDANSFVRFFFFVPLCPQIDKIHLKLGKNHTATG